MALLKDGRIVPDPFQAVGDADPLPEQGAVLVALARWHAERPLLLARPDPVGVRLTSSQTAGEIADDLAHLALVALDLPKFRDGRAFSTARGLRERYRYTGEIRAVGHIIPDQYLFLVRCGVDTVSVPDQTSEAVWREALGAFTVAYQPAITGDTPLSLLRRRLAPGGTA